MATAITTGAVSPTATMGTEITVIATTAIAIAAAITMGVAITAGIIADAAIPDTGTAITGAVGATTE